MKPKILITLQENGQNGGPYISHLRIMNNVYLNTMFEFEPLFIPRTRKMLNPFFFLRFIKKIKKAHPDLVHIGGLQMEGFWPMLACKLLRKKTVLAVHGSSSEAVGNKGLRKNIGRVLEKYTIKNATIVYGVSDYVSSWEICKKSKRFFGTIYNICNYQETPSVKSTIREELGISSTDCVVVSTGRITTEKGFDDLLKIILKFKNHNDIKFIIAGDGPFFCFFQNAIKNNKMEKQVFLLGYRSDIQNILVGSDVFIICTRHETLCISLLEAGLCGLPLVATNVGGIPEIIDDTCGFLIDVGDLNGFEKSIIALLDKNKRISMGKKSHEKIVNKFNTDCIVRKIRDLYLEALK